MSAAGQGWSDRRLHFIGIGGAGMSGLALVCARLGASVSGSDRADSSYMERLRAEGLRPVVGHDAANLPPGAEVVVSTAIAADNPELARAREEGLEPIHRAELLAELCAEKRLIAVAGTHGKTTTTAMVTWALRELGADPAFFIGGEVPGAGRDGGAANAGWGDGEWAVAEADESDGSFLRLRPEVAVVTNLELDHHSRWGSLGELAAAFRRFLAPADGLVLSTQAAAALGEKAGSSFDLRSPGPDPLELRVLGAHNLLNARAAIAAVERAGFDGAEAARALASFPGVRRRLEFKGSYRGSRVFDDYAHHPTELRAALEALRGERPGSLVVLFQPHLYSRTKSLAESFGAALADADEVVVMDVYPAREEPVGPLEGVSGRLVLAAAADRMGGRCPWWAPTADSALRALRALGGGEGRLVVTIGAGDVFQVGERLVAEDGS